MLDIDLIEKKVFYITLMHRIKDKETLYMYTFLAKKVERERKNGEEV